MVSARPRSACAARWPPPTRIGARVVAHRPPAPCPAAAAAAASASASLQAVDHRRWCSRPAPSARPAASVRWPLYSARLSSSCGPSTTSATCHRSHRLAAARGATMMSRKSSRRLQPRLDLHHALLLARAQRAGGQFLVLAAHARPSPGRRRCRSASIAAGLQVDVDLALDAADQRHRADAAHVLQPLLASPGRPRWSAPAALRAAVGRGHRER